MDGGTFSVHPSVEVHPGDTVLVHAEGFGEWRGTVTAPGEFRLDAKLWPFGTILRTRAVPSHKVLVLRDDGESWSAMLLTGTRETATGTVLHNLFRPNWEPDD